MLNIAVLDPEEFLSWLGNGRLPKPSVQSLSWVRKRLSSAFCGVAIRGGNNVLDVNSTVVVVEENRMQDFFAFVSTYVNEFAPFSAYFRVVSTNQIELISEDASMTFNGATSVIDRLVGTAIVEAAIYLQGSGEAVRPVTIAAAGATFSAAALQGLALSPKADVYSISQGWQSLRAALGSDQLPLNTDALARFWQILRVAVHGGEALDVTVPDVILSALRTVMANGRLDDVALENLLSSLPELAGDLSRFRGTREGRARAIQEAISVLSRSRGDEDQLRDCVAGCLISLIGDGSFKFMPAALSTSSILRMAPLWFAVWSGLQTNSDIMTEFNCMGRRIARDLRARVGVYDGPNDDISVMELMSWGSDVEQLPREHASSISVEIYPWVSSRQSIARVSAAASNQSNEYRRDIRELRALMAHSTEILSRIDRGYSPETGQDADPPYRQKPSYRRKS